MEVQHRSRPYGDGTMQIEPYRGGAPPYGYGSDSGLRAQTQMGNASDFKLRKWKSLSSGSRSWGLSDPEFQRKKRVASYKMHSVEGKFKGSLRKSFRWLKERYARIVYGWS